MIFNSKPKLLGDPKDIIFKLEFVHTLVRSDNENDQVDVYILYYNKRSGETISLAIPHGRLDIAQYIQERLNEK